MSLQHHILESSPEPSISILAPIGYQTGDCGYCKGENQSVSYYASSKSISVDHYQILVDRGWRRSGTLFYKPDLRHSCCPHYTIRIPVKDFKARKDQRQAVNRWNKHVLGDDYQKEAAKQRRKSKADKARARNEFDLTTALSESEYEHLPKSPPEPAHKFEVTLEPDEYTEEKFELFSNYQQHVHRDPPSQVRRPGFRRFLCESPLRNWKTREANSKEQKLGSFHQCYRLDGRLIAMGVLDLLPHCVSGVYFIYHSDFEKFSFGKISALREAALALEGGYQYYYMGYYIHSCTKMRYKNDYQPQYFLDLETLEWNKLDEEASKLLDEHHYLSMSLVREAQRAADATAGAQNPKDDGDTKMSNSTDAATSKLQLPAPKRKVYDSASEAEAATMTAESLYDVEFAGMMTVEELESAVDLDRMRVRLSKDMTVRAEQFKVWDEWDILEPGANMNIKALIAQLAACVGPEVASEAIISLCG